MILGAHKIREREETQQRFTVKKSDGVVVHPGWDAEKTENDIALVPLPQPAQLNGTTRARTRDGHQNDVVSRSHP